MHEAGIALQLIECVIDRLETVPHGPVRQIHVRIGAMSGVCADALDFAFGCLARGTGLEAARLVFEVVPLTVACAACGATNPVEEYVFRCPACGSERTEIASGRELEVRKLEVEDVEVPCHA
ncbi:MAG: hydrogenase maturation nickel metallochaperone HypA [Gemmatimonadales bacterium]|nr:hydrogenase maturation nickel metallochaperone HypA [Gemmatimonadales bacterium]